MLLIRAAQMEAFRDDRLRQLAERIFASLRPLKATAGLPDGALRARVLAGVAKSVAMGFEESELVEASVRLMFDFHPGYVGHPDVKAILAREGSTPREKLLAILAWYGRATWAGSFDQLAGGAWQ